MAIDKIASVGASALGHAGQAPKSSFAKIAQPKPSPPPKLAQLERAPQVVSRPHPHRPAGAGPVQAKASVGASHAARVLEHVAQAQRRLDHILELAQRGHSFTPAQLLAMQAHVFQASQEIDLAGKVAEKASAGVKQILQTQI